MLAGMSVHDSAVGRQGATAGLQHQQLRRSFAVEHKKRQKHNLKLSIHYKVIKMKINKMLLLAQMIGCSILIANNGCTKDHGTGVTDPPTVKNKPPIANAGPDQTIMKPRDNIRLSGDLSHDSDGSIVAYIWKTVSGPNSPDINNDFIANLKPYEKFVLNLEEGVYQFELMVTDNDRAASRDTIKVTVLPDSLIRDPSRMKRFNSVWWGDSCAIRINNISSAIPSIGSFQVFMASYSGGGPMSSGIVQSSGWHQIQPVRSSASWYEIRNDVLIIHAAANIICDWDDAVYDVLIKWN
jgi:hypothetical protein